MRKGIVSVVLPIYNVEKYLNRCVKSVINQSYKDLEIILVDDGALDSCPRLCDEWAEKDDRIKVVHKKNAGLGYARNTGIECATGEYICFFDSDDYIAPDTIEKAYAAAVRDDCDIVLFGHYDVNNQGKIVRSYLPKPRKNIYTGTEIQQELLPDLIANDPATGNHTDLWMSAWSCLYSMRMIVESNWRFASEREIISEDVYSLLRLYKWVKRAVILPEAFYYYCENESSLTHTYKKDRFEKIKHFYQQCLELCAESGYSDLVQKRLAYPFMSNTIAAMKMVEKANLTRIEKKKNISAIVHDSVTQDTLRQLRIDKEPITRKVLFFAMKYRMDTICFWLVKAKS